jgi:DNA-binding transcriptional ArsR family regulator
MNLDDFISKADEAENFLKALANRHRLMILCELHHGERSVTTLQQTVGLSQSALSQHLARLRGDGLVHTRRESQAIFYRLSSSGVSRIIALLHELYCSASCVAPAPTPLEETHL